MGLAARLGAPPAVWLGGLGVPGDVDGLDLRGGLALHERCRHRFRSWSGSFVGLGCAVQVPFT